MNNMIKTGLGWSNQIGGNGIGWENNFIIKHIKKYKMAKHKDTKYDQKIKNVLKGVLSSHLQYVYLLQEHIWNWIIMNKKFIEFT